METNRDRVVKLAEKLVKEMKKRNIEIQGINSKAYVSVWYFENTKSLIINSHHWEKVNGTNKIFTIAKKIKRELKKAGECHLSIFVNDIQGETLLSVDMGTNNLCLQQINIA